MLPPAPVQFVSQFPFSDEDCGYFAGVIATPVLTPLDPLLSENNGTFKILDISYVNSVLSSNIAAASSPYSEVLSHQLNTPLMDENDDVFFDDHSNINPCYESDSTSHMFSSISSHGSSRGFPPINTTSVSSYTVSSLPSRHAEYIIPRVITRPKSEISFKFLGRDPSVRSENVLEVNGNYYQPLSADAFSLSVMQKLYHDISKTGLGFIPTPYNDGWEDPNQLHFKGFNYKGVNNDSVTLSRDFNGFMDLLENSLVFTKQDRTSKGCLTVDGERYYPENTFTNLKVPKIDIIKKKSSNYYVKEMSKIRSFKSFICLLVFTLFGVGMCDKEEYIITNSTIVVTPGGHGLRSYDYLQPPVGGYLNRDCPNGTLANNGFQGCLYKAEWPAYPSHNVSNIIHPNIISFDPGTLYQILERGPRNPPFNQLRVAHNYDNELPLSSSACVIYTPTGIKNCTFGDTAGSTYYYVDTNGKFRYKSDVSSVTFELHGDGGCPSGCVYSISFFNLTGDLIMSNCTSLSGYNLGSRPMHLPYTLIALGSTCAMTSSGGWFVLHSGSLPVSKMSDALITHKFFLPPFAVLTFPSTNSRVSTMPLIRVPTIKTTLTPPIAGYQGNVYSVGFVNRSTPMNFDLVSNSSAITTYFQWFARRYSCYRDSFLNGNDYRYIIHGTTLQFHFIDCVQSPGIGTEVSIVGNRVLTATITCMDEIVDFIDYYFDPVRRFTYPFSIRLDYCSQPKVFINFQGMNLHAIDLSFKSYNNFDTLYAEFAKIANISIPLENTSFVSSYQLTGSNSSFQTAVYDFNLKKFLLLVDTSNPPTTVFSNTHKFIAEITNGTCTPFLDYDGFSVCHYSTGDILGSHFYQAVSICTASICQNYDDVIKQETTIPSYVITGAVDVYAAYLQRGHGSSATIVIIIVYISLFFFVLVVLTTIYFIYINYSRHHKYREYSKSKKRHELQNLLETVQNNVVFKTAVQSEEDTIARAYRPLKPKIPMGLITLALMFAIACPCSCQISIGNCSYDSLIEKHKCYFLDSTVNDGAFLKYVKSCALSVCSNYIQVDVRPIEVPFYIISQLEPLYYGYHLRDQMHIGRVIIFVMYSFAIVLPFSILMVVYLFYTRVRDAWKLRVSKIELATSRLESVKNDINHGNINGKILGSVGVLSSSSFLSSLVFHLIILFAVVNSQEIVTTKRFIDEFGPCVDIAPSHTYTSTANVSKLTICITQHTEVYRAKLSLIHYEPGTFYSLAKLCGAPNPSSEVALCSSIEKYDLPKEPDFCTGDKTFTTDCVLNSHASTFYDVVGFRFLRGRVGGCNYIHNVLATYHLIYDAMPSINHPRSGYLTKVGEYVSGNAFLYTTVPGSTVFSQIHTETINLNVGEIFSFKPLSVLHSRGFRSIILTQNHIVHRTKQVVYVPSTVLGVSPGLYIPNSVRIPYDDILAFYTTSNKYSTPKCSIGMRAPQPYKIPFQNDPTNFTDWNDYLKVRAVRPLPSLKDLGDSRLYSPFDSILSSGSGSTKPCAVPSPDCIEYSHKPTSTDTISITVNSITPTERVTFSSKAVVTSVVYSVGHCLQDSAFVDVKATITTSTSGLMTVSLPPSCHGLKSYVISSSPTVLHYSCETIGSTNFTHKFCFSGSCSSFSFPCTPSMELYKNRVAVYTTAGILESHSDFSLSHGVWGIFTGLLSGVGTAVSSIFSWFTGGWTDIIHIIILVGGVILLLFIIGLICRLPIWHMLHISSGRGYKHIMSSEKPHKIMDTMVKVEPELYGNYLKDRLERNPELVRRVPEGVRSQLGISKQVVSLAIICCLINPTYASFVDSPAYIYGSIGFFIISFFSVVLTLFVCIAKR